MNDILNLERLVSLKNSKTFQEISILILRLSYIDGLVYTLNYGGFKKMVFDKVKEIVAERLDVADDEITMEAVITGDLGADSLDVVDLVMDLEDAFSIEIPDEAMADIKTIGDIVAYIEKETK